MKRKSIVLKIFTATLILIAGLLSVQLAFSQIFLTKYYEKAKIFDLKNNLELLKSEAYVDISDSSELEKLQKKFVQFEEKHGVTLAFTNSVGVPIYGLEQTYANSEIEIKDNSGFVHILPIDTYQNKELIEGSGTIVGKDISLELGTIDNKNSSIPILESTPIYISSDASSNISTESVDITPNTLIVNIDDSKLSEIAESTDAISIVEATPVTGTITALNIADITSSSSSYREKLFYDYINSFIFSKRVSDLNPSLISSKTSDVNLSSTTPSTDDPNFLSVEKVEDGETSISNYMVAMKIHMNSEDDYWLFTSLPVQSLKDASGILSYYSIYLFVFLLFIGGLFAFLYAKKLAKPILSMNDIAKEMAKLNFDSSCIISSNDELSDLGQNLNHLSNTLKYTLDDLQKANAKLKIDIEKERTRDAEQKAFVATLSHELKTPLMIMRGTAEGIAAGIYEKEKLSSILSELSAMDHLIGEMLQFSKSESLKIDTTTINLGTMLSNICKRLNPLRDDIEKKFLIEGDFTVNFDKNHLDKILSNMYHNALRYTPEGETIYVSIIRDESKHPHIRIENTGIFLSDENLQKIWEPFYRVEDSRNRQTGGHGLGLYIVKRLTYANNASIKVSNTSRGVCFDIEFKN